VPELPTTRELLGKSAQRYPKQNAMNTPGDDEILSFWNRTAQDWDIQVGREGDTNRILNSDPVLWVFAGDVRGRKVLDVGCGTAYLSKQATDRGASVTGVDLSDRMIEIARGYYPSIEFRVDSCAELRTVGNAQFDIVIANYVLMDTPELEATMHNFHRVLRDEGLAVLVFSHPCFPQGRAQVSTETQEVSYRWTSPYFERRRCVDPPWGHFTSDFIWFHRPLSDYWKAFRSAGFMTLEFEEPRVVTERYHLAPNPKTLANSKARPYSVAFKLQKQ
jgi:ubiquinone/menaquinone biosynthesis C-methylase UbiE